MCFLKTCYNTYMNKLTNLARTLRKNSTKQERILWKILRNRQFKNLKFKRQIPIDKYIADFVCEEKKLIIEIDGGQHNKEENISKDNIRTKILTDEGYKVVRFWNNEIENNLEGVYKKLLDVIEGI